MPGLACRVWVTGGPAPPRRTNPTAHGYVGWEQTTHASS